MRLSQVARELSSNARYSSCEPAATQNGDIPHLFGMEGAIGVRMGDAGPAAVERAGAGDELAFAELVEAYHHDMLRVAYVVLADASLAEDAAQAAWINAWRNLKQLRDPNKVRAWLLAITTNEARQLSRRQRRSHDEMESVASASIADPALLDLARALARLSNNERRLLSLKFVGGLSSDEIGDALGVSANAVRHRLMRLLYRLREELDR